MPARLNEIKDREAFRLVAPVVLQEEEAAPVVLRACNDGGGVLASADTHGHQPVAAAAALQLVLQLNRELFLLCNGFVLEVGRHAEMAHILPRRASPDH